MSCAEVILDRLTVKSSFDGAIEPIFDSIVSTTFKLFADKTPFTAILGMKLQNSAIFFDSPFLFINRWIKLVVPSFSALFANSTIELFGNQTPLFGAINMD